VTPNDLICELVNEASALGEEAVPSELLAAIAMDANPLASLQESDRGNAFFAALHRDLPFTMRVGAGAPLQEDERSRWVSLLRWLLAQLRQWDSNADPRQEKLVAILVMAQAHDGDGALWRAVPADVFQNAALAARFEAFVSNFTMTFGARGIGPEPIWEREAVDRLLAVEGKCDWANMGDAWRPFQDLIHPSALQTQAVRFLSCADLARLAKAVVNVKQVAVAMMVAQILDTHHRLLLALASGNHFIEFSCAYVTLNGRRLRPTSLSGEAGLFTRLLAKIAPDAMRWRGWMTVFNTYPVRYPALHPCLGEALASAPETAIDAYVNTIHLFPHPVSQADEGRRNVAVCLRAFRTRASADQRRLLWQRAHKRWLAWRFDAADNNTHLLAVSRSELDYAIVGFAMECLDSTAQTEALTEIGSWLRAMEYAWYKSEADIKSAWFRELSIFQPYAHAVQVGATTEDWLIETRVYCPSEVANNPYLKLRYPSG
jgi:hypothetical protein